MTRQQPLLVSPSLFPQFLLSSSSFSKQFVTTLMAPPDILVLSADEEQVLETQTFANKRQQVVLTIRGLGLEGFMDGSIPVPSKIARNRGGEEVPNPLYMQYIKQDSSLASWLLSTVSPHILPQLMGSETTAGIWKTITDKYSKLSTTKVMNFHCRLRSMKKGTQSVTKYAMVIKQTCDLLASCGNPISEIEHIATILNGLPIEFEPSIAAITASKESYSVDNIVSILVDAETRMEDSTRFPIGINYTKYNGKHVTNNGEEYVVDSQDLPRTTVNHAGGKVSSLTGSIPISSKCTGARPPLLPPPCGLAIPQLKHVTYHTISNKIWVSKSKDPICSSRLTKITFPMVKDQIMLKKHMSVFTKIRLLQKSQIMFKKRLKVHIKKHMKECKSLKSNSLRHVIIAQLRQQSHM
ncbi:hypothetical protein GQ457_04G018030 [Hibiscus cannabinus]